MLVSALLKFRGCSVCKSRVSQNSKYVWSRRGRGLYPSTTRAEGKRFSKLILVPMRFFSSFHELIQSRGVRRLSVCLSVNFLRKSFLLRHKWGDCDQTCTRWLSRWARIQGVLKVKVTGTWLIWLHKNRFFFHANGCILTKLSLSVTFPSLCPFRFSASQFPNGCSEFALWVPQ